MGHRCWWVSGAELSDELLDSSVCFEDRGEFSSPGETTGLRARSFWKGYWSGLRMAQGWILSPGWRPQAEGKVSVTG